MIRMQTAAPTNFAYFEVHIPIKDDLYTADVERIVDRYLYGGFTRDEAVVNPDATHYVVPVTFSGTGPLDHTRSVVRTQTDRLASGMYRTTEPTFYEPIQQG